MKALATGGVDDAGTVAFVGANVSLSEAVWVELGEPIEIEVELCPPAPIALTDLTYDERAELAVRLGIDIRNHAGADERMHIYGFAALTGVVDERFNAAAWSYGVPPESREGVALACFIALAVLAGRADDDVKQAAMATGLREFRESASDVDLELFTDAVNAQISLHKHLAAQPEDEQKRIRASWETKIRSSAHRRLERVLSVIRRGRLRRPVRPVARRLIRAQPRRRRRGQRGPPRRPGRPGDEPDLDDAGGPT